MLEARGALLMSDELKKAKAAVASMQKIEALTDADITEVNESIASFQDVESRTRPIGHLLDFLHAIRWLDPKDKTTAKLIDAFFDNQYGNAIAVLSGKPTSSTTFATLLASMRQRIHERRFFHWEIAFPGVWSNWESAEPEGGFDAVIGNPPWDRIKFQEVEWFAARKPEIALTQRAADRNRMVERLKKAKDPLVIDYERAVETAETAARVARTCDAYPLLSGGDTNIYSLFFERAASMIRKDGFVGLLTPSGIASDKTAAPFFRSIATTGRLYSLYDFENRKVFFPDVHASFKFCALIFGGIQRAMLFARCAFYLHNVSEIRLPDRVFDMTAADFNRVNPNTGTAAIFRTRRDAEITKLIYERLPVLVNHSGKKSKAAFPVEYFTMFHMTNDSNKGTSKNCRSWQSRTCLG
jgi:hypothetical protein